MQLEQKDEAIEGYRKIISELHGRLTDEEKRHQQQLVEARQDREQQVDERLGRLREIADSLGNPTSEQETMVTRVSFDFSL